MCALTIADQTRIALIGGFNSLLGQPFLKGQALRTPAVAEIPFAFRIGFRSMPAGTYIVEIKGKDVFSIKGDSGMTVTVVMWASPSRRFPESAIIFHRLGGEYILREIRSAGNQGYLWNGEAMAELRARLREDAASDGSGSRQDKVEIALLAPYR